MVPGRQQGFHQNVSILVGRVGIPQQALLLHQVKRRPVALAGEQIGVQAHQHDDAVGDGAHRLKGTDGERAAAVAEATAVDGQLLIQQGRHHGRLQHQGIGLASGLLPSVNGSLQQRQFPRRCAPIAKQIQQQFLQPGRPDGAAAGLPQLAQPMAQPGQEVQPATGAFQVGATGGGGNATGGQAGNFGQHQGEQEAVDHPGEAVGRVAAPLVAIEAPAEATALQHLVELRHLRGRQAKTALQGLGFQQPFQGSGGEAIAGHPQQAQEGARNTSLTLLAAIGEAPGQIHPRRLPITKHRGQQRREAIHIRGHHQDVARLKAGVGRQQLQQPIPHDLHLAQRPRTAMKFKGGVLRGTHQGAGVGGIGQLLLQLQ